jgi:hypothetical protein
MPAVAVISHYSHLWTVIRTVLEEQRQRESLIQEELSFYVYRSDTNGVLARGILGYEAAKERANQIRKQQGLPWSVVKFKAERTSGFNADGRQFRGANASGRRIEYAPRVNPSKGLRFRGYYDAQGEFHDID